MDTVAPTRKGRSRGQRRGSEAMSRRPGRGIEESDSPEAGGSDDKITTDRNKSEQKLNSKSKFYVSLKKRNSQSSLGSYGPSCPIVVVEETRKGSKLKLVSNRMAKMMRADGFVVNEKKRLGSGSFGIVYGATHEGHKIACKVIDPNRTKNPMVQYYDERLPRELEITAKLSHRFIIESLAIYRVNDEEHNLHKVYIFMERAGGKDLFSMVQQRSANGLNEDLSKKLFREISQAVEYIHGQRVAHRDIKAENVLIDANGVAKLCDFGLAEYVPPAAEEQKTSRTFCGSWHYRAPELVRKEIHALLPTDVWSLGCLLFVMLSKSLPFKQMGRIEQLQEQEARAYSTRFRSGLSVEVKDLVQRMLEPRVEQRPSIKEVRSHQWVDSGHV